MTSRDKIIASSHCEEHFMSLNQWEEGRIRNQKQDNFNKEPIRPSGIATIALGGMKLLVFHFGFHLEGEGVSISNIEIENKLDSPNCSLQSDSLGKVVSKAAVIAFG